MNDPQSSPQPISPAGLLVGAFLLVAVAIGALEHFSQDLLTRQREAGGTLPAQYARTAPLVNRYLRAREHVLSYWPLYALGVVAVPLACFIGFKKLAAHANRSQAKEADMEFEDEKYAFPYQKVDFLAAVEATKDPQEQVFLGARPDGTAVVLTDKTRDTHVHILGQIGSGKTKSALEPLMYQDLRRGRGVLLLDAKGSEDNEQRLAAMVDAAGRLDQLKVFTLNRRRRSHTYNPVHLLPDADPQAIAERVFSTFEAEMDNQYYKDQARALFVPLVRALAATGKPFHMLDVYACIADLDVLDHALELSSDAAAKAEIKVLLAGLGKKVGETFTGLQAAVKRYDHPNLNVYAPDIVLEQLMDDEGVAGFFLPVNSYKQLARYVGTIVLQHLQQLGALRQQDRSRIQTPLYVFADEFYNFAYEGFLTALNMLRDARVSFHIAHQSISDLERVSPEFAAGVWDNCRTKLVLLQTNPDLCERLAKTLGTKKGISKTVRRSVDGFLNQVNMMEASSKQVDEFRLHPTCVKMLKTFQAYLAQDTAFEPVNLQIIPDDILPQGSEPPRPRSQAVEGVELYKLFVQRSGGAPRAA
jgi:type IV secretory pathway TraG/TraD family ATPase VirD4